MKRITLIVFACMLFLVSAFLLCACDKKTEKSKVFDVGKIVIDAILAGDLETERIPY